MHERHHNCYYTKNPVEIIVKFEKPLKIELDIHIITPEPQVRGLLTLGPVSDKKDKVI